MEINKENYVQFGGNYGWICPVCKRVLAPFVSECPCHGQPNWELTSTTSCNCNCNCDNNDCVTVELNNQDNKIEEVENE